MQDLTKKNTQLSQELEECKAQLRAAVAALKESEKAPLVTLVSIAKNDRYQIVCGMHTNLTIDSADDSGVNPEVMIGNEPHAQRQLKAGEHVLKRLGRRKTISKMPISSWAWN